MTHQAYCPRLIRAAALLLSGRTRLRTPGRPAVWCDRRPFLQKEEPPPPPWSGGGGFVKVPASRKPPTLLKHPDRKKRKWGALAESSKVSNRLIMVSERKTDSRNNLPLLQCRSALRHSPSYLPRSLPPGALKRRAEQLHEGCDMRIFRPGPNTHVVLTHHWSLVAGCRHEWRLGRHSRGRGRERFKSLQGGEP